MESNEIRKYLHDLSNCLNAAKINAFLLRRMYGSKLDEETIDSLDSSIQDAERIVAEFRTRVHQDLAKSETVHHSSHP